MMIKDHNLEK